PLFLLDRAEFFNSFSTPGGFLNYLSAFFTELYSIPFTGSIVITLLISFLPIAINIKAFSNSTNLFSLLKSTLLLIVAILLFVIPAFKISSFILILLAYFFAFIYIQLVKRLKNIAVLILFLAITSYFLYVLLGGFGLLLSNAITIIRILYSKQITKAKYPAVIAIALANLIIPFIFVRTIFQLVPINVSYLGDFFTDEHYIVPKLYYALIGLILVIELLKPFNISKGSIKWGIPILLAFTIVGIFFGSKSIKSTTESQLLKIDYYAYNKQWNEVLKLVKNDLTNNQLAVFQANRAFYFTNNLLNDVFSIPQNFRINSLLLEQYVNRNMLVAASDIYFDMGLINESRHWIHEAFTSLGMQPRILKRMVEVNIINENYTTARKYIGLLKKSFVNRKWALNYERIIKNHSVITGFPDLEFKRQIMPQSDFFINRHAPIQNLLNFIDLQNANKMVLEYLVTYYLFEHDVIHVVKLIPNFRKNKYDELPKLVQETLILYMVKTQQKTIDIMGYKIAKNNFKRFNEYSKLYTFYKKNDRAAKAKLDARYADSYWYYIHFLSPITRSKK
nr:DUF6057 family protein [Salinivirgaceae bacterium]